MRCVDGLGAVCDERFRVYRKEIKEFKRRSDIREGRLLKTSSLGSSLVELALYQNAASSSMSIVSVPAKKHRVKRRSNQLRCPQMNWGLVVELCRSIAEISGDRKNEAKRSCCSAVAGFDGDTTGSSIPTELMPESS